MKENFEEQFMDIQAGLISLCLEVTNNEVDKVFAYASIEKKTRMFNAFFEKDGEILTINQLGVDEKTAFRFLRLGTSDLVKIRELCEENETETPSQIKMYYDCKTGKYDADYKYGEICTPETGLESGAVFMQWYQEVKETSF